MGSLLLTLALIVSSMPAVVAAQDDTGRKMGGYTVNQTIEFGGRITGTSGNEDVYNTFVNLQNGPRLLDYSLNMRSDVRVGTIFDDLSFTNSGYGGDPLDISRLRMSKNRWYNFNAQFRRDVNFYDFNFLANPWNYGPTAANPTGATVVGFNHSIHPFNTRRKMGDFNLTLAPDSPIRVRLGYSRNYNEGPSYSSFHEGTDVQLFQFFGVRQDSYAAGVDVRIAPRTTLSFDETYTHGRNNTYYTDTNVNNGFFVQTASGPRPVDIGAIYYPYYNQPCAGVRVSATGVVTQSGTAPNGCQTYANYARNNPFKMNVPAEQLTLTSNYWKRLDITASATYSSAESKIDNYFETMNYWVSRINEIGAQYTGPTRARRIDSGADAGVTFHFTDSFSLSNQFRFQNFRTPGTWDSHSVACYPAMAGNNAAFTGPYTPALGTNPACASIVASGITAGTQPLATYGPDLTAQLFSRFLGLKSIFNTSIFEWNPGHRFGAHIGYRYGTSDLNIGEFDGAITQTFLGTPVGTRPGNGATRVTGTDLSDSPTEFENVQEHTLLFGFKTRPIDGLNISTDLEWAYADNTFTPISPRNYQLAKVRGTYRVAKWGSVNGSVNIRESRNNRIPLNPADEATGVVTAAFPAAVKQPRHQDHFRGYTFGMTLNPMDRVAIDLGYTFNDVFMTSGSCLMASGSAASPMVPVGGNIARCSNVLDPFSVTNGIGQAIPAVLDYGQSTHNGYFNVMFKPVSRVTLTLGYDLVTDSGKNNWLRADNGQRLAFFVDQAGNPIITSSGGSATPGTGQVISGSAYGPNTLVPLGTQNMSWHRPSGAIEIGLTKTVSFKGQYNYYDYNEHGGAAAAGPVQPRDMHANVGTVSLKYAF